jgi:hypothetical protein
MPRHARDEDAAAELKTFLARVLGQDDYRKCEALLAAMSEGATDDEPGAGERWPNRLEGAQDGRPVFAMDSSDAFTRMRDLRSAERVVAPHVGEILGMDSAAAVFAEALRRLGYDGSKPHPSALPEIFRLRVGIAAANAGRGDLPPRLDPAAAKGFGRLIGGRSPRVL